jgi:hypothetical protein
VEKAKRCRKEGDKGMTHIKEGQEGVRDKDMEKLFSWEAKYVHAIK